MPKPQEEKDIDVIASHTHLLASANESTPETGFSTSGPNSSEHPVLQGKSKATKRLHSQESRCCSRAAPVPLHFRQISAASSSGLAAAAESKKLHARTLASPRNATSTRREPDRARRALGLWRRRLDDRSQTSENLPSPMRSMGPWGLGTWHWAMTATVLFLRWKRRSETKANLI